MHAPAETSPVSLEPRTIATPVIVAGMHRSGTSLSTSFLEAMGLDVGSDLVPGDANNRRGYFEDRRFLELNRRIVAECCDAEDSGHPDWGWTERESFDASRLASYADEGRQLLEEIGARSRPWGFKDPRSTLLLDFWDQLLDDARYVLVYRHPWDVADSMQRLGADVFLRRPDYAPRIWSVYNRHLLEFYRRHRERCVLASTHALIEQPEAFAEQVIGKLGLELDAARLGAVYDEQELTNRPCGDPLPRLFAATYPETLSVLRTLEAEADLPTVGRWAVSAAEEALRPYRFTPSPEVPEPPVAVVIPCRDHGHQVIDAIASVERSIPEPYELILVDDGSKDPATVGIMARLREAGYHVEHQEPSGVCAARNRAFKLVRAPYVIPLDADNRLRQGPFLAAAIAELEADPGLGVVYGDRYEFGLRQGRVAGGEFDIHRLLSGNYIDTCSVIRWTTWKDVGGYDEQILTWEDWELWIRVARRGWRFRHLDQVAFDYRVRPGSKVSTAGDPQVLKRVLDRVATNHREVLKNHLVQQLGHSLAAWPFLLLEEQERLRGLVAATGESGPGTEESAQASANPALESSESFELARARLAAVEAAREAERAGWRLEHAKTSAQHFEDSAKRLQDQLAARDEVVRVQQASLDDLRKRAELAESAYQQVEAESALQREDSRRVGLAYERAIREIDGLRQQIEHLVAANETEPPSVLARLWQNLLGGGTS
ncbi:MAG: glycosyltransferase [Acidobacteriota bacterium]